MWQMGGFGPMLGQAHHFRRFAPEKVPYAIDRYTSEAKRLYGVLEKRLSEAAYLAGEYSIADMAVFPWVTRHEWQGVDIAELPHVKRWLDAIGARVAVKAGLAVP
jgi:GST-like protein